MNHETHDNFPSRRRRGEAVPPSPQEIDGSCRWPVGYLFAKSLGWLLIGTVCLAIALLEIAFPQWMPASAWITYGRIFPAGSNALVYGFGVQFLFGVSLWLLARMGQVTLKARGPTLLAAVIWNLGVLAGFIGILAGQGTGYAWLEMPSYAVAPLLCSGLFLLTQALLVFHARRERSLCVPQWYLLAGLLWLAWIFTTAHLMLNVWPVRGVMQTVVETWFARNLFHVCMPSIGLACIFYLLPKVLNRPLHSESLARFAFWALILFGGWGGFSISLPLPRWIIAASTVGEVLVVFSLIAVALNLYRTVMGESHQASLDATPIPVAAGVRRLKLIELLRVKALRVRASLRRLLHITQPLKFLLLGVACYLLNGVLEAVMAFPKSGALVEFTFFDIAQIFLVLLGFLGTAGVAVMGYAIPCLWAQMLPCRWLGLVHRLGWFIGLPVALLPLLAGGLVQGIALNDPNISLVAVMTKLCPFLLASAIGMGLLAGAQFALLWNITLAFQNAMVSKWRSFWESNILAPSKTSEVEP